MLREDRFLCGCSHRFWEKCKWIVSGGDRPYARPDMVCSDNKNDSPRVVPRAFCCSIFCCIRDGSIDQHIKDMEEIKKNLLSDEHVLAAKASNPIPGRKRIDLQAKGTGKRVERAPFEQLAELKAKFDGRVAPQEHANCFSSYRQRLKLLLQPYQARAMDDDDMKRWKYMVWPEKHPYADKDLVQGRAQNVPIVEEICRCSDKNILGDAVKETFTNTVKRYLHIG